MRHIFGYDVVPHEGLIMAHSAREAINMSLDITVLAEACALGITVSRAQPCRLTWGGGISFHASTRRNADRPGVRGAGGVADHAVGHLIAGG
jgi:hypothetical protein